MSVAARAACPLVVGCGLLTATAAASPVVELGPEAVRASGPAAHTPRSAHSLAVVHGFRCSEARGILLDQGWNLCLLHWWADSLPLSH